MTEIRVEPADWAVHLGVHDGPQIVVGGPGTGKTEFLVRRTVSLADDGGVDPSRVLVLSFSRRGAADIEHRVHAELGRTTRRFDISTFHSFSLRLLERHAAARGWERPPALLVGAEQTSFVRRLLSSEDPAAWSPAYRSVVGTRTFASEVRNFLLRCREQALDGGDIEKMDRSEWRGLPDFFDRYDHELRRTGRIDYGTLLTEAIALLEIDRVRDETGAQYRYVIVDEYQDTTKAQARLLRALVFGHRNITVAADPYQSIYSFRGADLQNVHRFPEEFTDAEGSPARRLVLTTSHRVPRAILDAAVRVTSHQLPGAAGPVVPASGEGSVETYRFEQQTEEAEWIASEALRLHLEQRIPYSRIGVFVRSKRRLLPELSRALDRRGVPHERPGSRLADQPAVRFLFDCVLAATGMDGMAESGRAVRRVLLGPVFQLRLGQVRELERLRIRLGADWPGAIRAGLPEAEALAALFEDPRWARSLPAGQGLWHVWSSLPQLRTVAADEERGEERAAWSSTAQVLSRWNERDPRATLVDYLRLTEEEEFEASPLLSYRRPVGDYMTLTTLHQAKGLDVDVVFIADAVEGAFPDLRARDSLLGTRHLSPDLPTDTLAYQAFRLQEERRIAYTAMTRAARRVVWTATDTGFDEGGGVPSRFMALVAGTATVAEAVSRPQAATTPITAAEAESRLRRTVADPAAAAPDRLAALSVLADGSAGVLRPISAFPGLRVRGPDTGVVPHDLRLSPSQAEVYETCPRRYALERRLGIGARPSPYTEFGSLIHTVLESVERVAARRGRRHAELGDALAELDRSFEPEAFGGGVFAAAWKERGRTALVQLYEGWPSDGEILELEYPLDLERPSARWTGRADRIEQRGGHLAVVDYKTGRKLATIADAKNSLQLGYYLISSREDSRLSRRGTAGEAELWFPLTKQRDGIAVRQFDPEAVPDVEERLAAVAEGIQAEAWPPKPGDHCRSCSVRLVCPAQPEGREAFAS